MVYTLSTMYLNNDKSTYIYSTCTIVSMNFTIQLTYTITRDTGTSRDGIIWLAYKMLFRLLLYIRYAFLKRY